MRLDHIQEVRKELRLLAGSLIKRMRLDFTSLTEDNDLIAQPEVRVDDSEQQEASTSSSRKWIALPRTLRLSTRPRPPLNSDGSRSRSFTRISKSGGMPSFVLNLAASVDYLAERLVEEALMPLFRKLHPEASGWNLSLVNVCATNMASAASDDKNGAGQDIGKMFSRQEHTLKEWRVDDIDVPPSDYEDDERHLEEGEKHDSIDFHVLDRTGLGSEDMRSLTQESVNDNEAWDSDEDMRDAGDACKVCGAVMPPYAMVAHERFHALPD